MRMSLNILNLPSSAKPQLVGLILFSATHPHRESLFSDISQWMEVSLRELEDNLNSLVNGRRSPFFGKMEDDLHFLAK
jgi:hypothetical protein